MQTKEMEFWNSEFGLDYTDRNLITPEVLDQVYLRDFGISRKEMNRRFLENKSIDKVLEVGANVGLQLKILQSMGYECLHGIELQWYAVEKAKEFTSHINIIQGSAFDLPYKDGYFDLVFTSGVLIHISPEDLDKIFDEMYRVTNRYIWGYEFFSDQHMNGEYRGIKDKMWKANFVELLLKRHPDLRLVEEERYKYLNNDNVNQMFLVEKVKHV